MVTNIMKHPVSNGNVYLSNRLISHLRKLTEKHKLKVYDLNCMHAWETE